MKISYVCQSYPPMVSGAALVIQRLAEGIAALGHSVIVLTASDQRCAYTRDGQGLITVLIESFPNPLRVDQSFVLWSQNEIFRTLKEFQPDILHVHDPLNLGVSAVRAAQKENIPTLLTIHQLPWFITTYLPLSARMKMIIESSIWRYSKWFFKQCDALITPSQMIADIIWEHTCFLPQVISNGVDLDLFSPTATHSIESQKLSEKYHLCPNRPVILYVGRIDPDKKVDLILQAFAKVVREVDAQLLIVGDGTQRDEIIQLSRSLDVHQYCSFPGFVPKDDDLPGIYRLGSVFVTASEIEIQSSVVLEAAASGLPVVTVQASSMPEFVVDGENGYLVSPRDIPALAERLICLVKNQRKSKMMGQAGRIIAETHSNQRFLQEHEQLYGSLLHLSNRELKEKTVV